MTQFLAVLKQVWPYLLSLALGFFVGFKVEQVELLNEKLNVANDTLVKWQEDAKLSKAWMTQFVKARDENEQLKAKAKADAARLNASLNGLQSDLTEAQRRLATASPETCNRAASACLSVLGTVERAGGELAKAADGHVRDVKQLMGAFPEKKE